MCNCTDEVWIGQPDVEGGSCVGNTGNSVRHITWSAYEKRAVENNSVTTQWRNVVRENCVKGLCVSCDLYALGSVYL